METCIKISFHVSFKVSCCRVNFTITPFYWSSSSVLVHLTSIALFIQWKVKVSLCLN